MRTVCAGLLVFAVGCSVESPDPSGDGTTMTGMPQAPRIEMKLTDAPGDFESVWVNITRVEVESADAGWQTLVEEPQRFDLLTLQNDVTAAMGSATLAPGMYGQLRLIVDEASVVIRVQDSGVGIPPHVLPNIFDLFEQADVTLARTEGGLGIGLTIGRSF